MQLHVNDGATAVFVDELSMALDMMYRWNRDWRTAEWWEKGKCIVRAMRMPQTDDEMIVISWTEFAPGKRIGHVELWNASDGCMVNVHTTEVF